MRHLIFSWVASMLLLAATTAASGQCHPNPTGETATGLQNASSRFLTFYIDGVNKGGVPSGDRSVDLLVTPGEHRLRAEAVINSEVVSANRVATVPAGHVCTWTVIDPQKVTIGTVGRSAPLKLFDSLKPDWAYITIAIPN